MNHICSISKAIEFGKRLDSCMRKAGLTAKMLADKIGASSADIERYKKGEIPHEEVVCEIANALYVSTEYLLEGKFSDDDIQEMKDNDLESRVNELSKKRAVKARHEAIDQFHQVIWENFSWLFIVITLITATVMLASYISGLQVESHTPIWLYYCERAIIWVYYGVCAISFLIGLITKFRFLAGLMGLSFVIFKLLTSYCSKPLNEYAAIVNIVCALIFLIALFLIYFNSEWLSHRSYSIRKARESIPWLYKLAMLFIILAGTLLLFKLPQILGLPCIGLSCVSVIAFLIWMMWKDRFEILNAAKKI